LRANVGAYLTGVSCLRSIVGAHLSARYNCRRALILYAKDGVPDHMLKVDEIGLGSHKMSLNWALPWTPLSRLCPMV